MDASFTAFLALRCLCQHGRVPGPPARAGGVLQVHHPGTQRDFSDTQTTSEHHGGAAEAAQHPQRHHRTIRQPVSLRLRTTPTKILFKVLIY